MVSLTVPLRVSIYTAALFSLGIVGGLIVAPVVPKSDANIVGWVALSNLIVAAVLVWLIGAARMRGSRLALGLAGAWFVVSSATSALEAYFFGLLSFGIFARLVASGLVVAVGLFAMVTTDERLRGRSSVADAGARWTPGRWLWRTAAVAAMYVVLYFAAGSIVILMPGLRQFYEARGLPSPIAVTAVQLFVRGPAFALVIAMLARLLGGSRAQSALAGAAVMALIGGVAPLIIPNPFFPDAIRWYHFVEVTSSNLVFGAIAGALMWPGRAGLGRPLRAQSAA